jgi:hypothetical protein
MLLSLAAVAQQKHADCFSVLNKTSYDGGPADVYPPSVRVMSVNAGSILAVKTWYTPTTSLHADFTTHTQFIKTSDGKHWTDAGDPYGMTTPDKLLALAESPRITTLFRAGKNGAVVERSTDHGKTWNSLKFRIDGLPLPDWIRKVDATPGAELVPRIGKVAAGNPTTLYASFQLWVPEPGNPKQFSHWKDVQGMYVSRDGGDSWNLFSPDLVVGSPLGISESNPLFMIGQLKEGLALSRDGGHSWNPVGQQKELKEAVSMTGYKEAVASQVPELKTVPLRDKPISFYGIEILRPDEKRIYLWSNIGLVVSRDEGQTWNVCPLGGKVYDMVNTILVPADVPHEVVVSTNAYGKTPSQVLLSKDDGRTFKVVFTMPSTM